MQALKMMVSRASAKGGRGGGDRPNKFEKKIKLINNKNLTWKF